MKRVAFYVSSLLLLVALACCTSRNSVSARLDTLDSLVSIPPSSPADTALYIRIISCLDTLKIDIDGDDAETEAHYNLIYAMAENRAGHLIPSVSHALSAYNFYAEQTQNGAKGDAEMLRRLALSSFYMGVYYDNIHETSLSKQMMQQATRVAQACGDSYTAYRALTYLSSQVVWNNPMEAVSLALESYNEFKKSTSKTPYNEISLLLNIGNCYLCAQMNDSVMPWYEKALDISLNQSDSLLLWSIYGNIANTYEIKGEHRKAMDYLHDIMQYFPSDPNYSACVIPANIYLSNDSLEQAKEMLYLSLASNDVHERLYTYHQLHRIAFLQQSDSIMALGDSIYLYANKLHVNEMLENYKYYQSMLEKEKSNAKLLISKEHRLYQTIITAIIILFLILFISFVLYHRNKRQEQLISLERMRRKITEERNKFELHQQEQIIHIQNEQLELFRKNLTQKSEVIEFFKSTDPKGNSYLPVSEDVWTELEVVLNTAYDNFVMRLRKLLPTVREDGIRLCMLSKLDLTNRQIANILSVEIPSVIKRKQRIKKLLSQSEFAITLFENP